MQGTANHKWIQVSKKVKVKHINSVGLIKYINLAKHCQHFVTIAFVKAKGTVMDMVSISKYPI